jgi:hypothetical protein
MIKKGNMMRKKILISGLLILTAQMLVSAVPNAGQARYNFNFEPQAGAAQQPLPRGEQPVRIQPGDQPIRVAPAQNAAVHLVPTLAAMQNVYAAQPTNLAKSFYITSVLDNNNPALTIENKLEQAQNLLKIIHAQMTLYTSWWPSAQEKAEIKWLQEQQATINQRIARLKAQASWFGMPTLWGTVQWTSTWLGIALLIYLSMNKVNDYYNEKDPEHPNQYLYNYADIATLPATKLYDLAKWSVVNGSAAITGKSARNFVNIIQSSAQATAEGIASTTGTVATAAKDRLTKDVNTLGKYIVDATKPAPPLTPEQKAAKDMEAYEKKIDEFKKIKIAAIEAEKQAQASAKAAQEAEIKKLRKQALGISEKSEKNDNKSHNPIGMLESWWEKREAQQELKRIEKAQEEAQKQYEKAEYETKKIINQHQKEIDKAELMKKNAFTDINRKLLEKNVPTLEEQAAMMKQAKMYMQQQQQQ